MKWDPHPGARPVLEAFRDEISAIYPELISLIAYGSAVGDQWNARRSNVNLLLVLPEVDAAVLERGAGVLRRFRARHRVLPLILARQELLDSVDVFPVEFSDIKEHHVVLKGEDLFDPLLIPGTWLRHQCEFELRGKYIRLRQGYLETDGKEKALHALMSQVLGGLLPLGRSLLRLAGERPPHAPSELIQQLARHYGFEARPWLEVLRLKEHQSAPRAAQAVYSDFLASVAGLVGRIDAAT